MRLINAEATEKEMLFWADTYGYGGLTKDNIREILRDSKKTPTVDATKVIRCEDCKYSYETIGVLICSHGICVDRVVRDAFYCADAERRQDE